VLRVLRGFNQERALLTLAVRGVSPAALESVQVEERDLADPSSRAATLTAIVPIFVIIAVLYGALNAALDTTAGERERGSLEPLLMNPATPMELSLGKWGAVAIVGMGIAILSCFSFLPGQWLLQSETLAALFNFGPREALWFALLLLPLAGAFAALLMAVAIRSKSFKEAQAGATILILLVNFLPLIQVMNQKGEQPWFVWVPALSQITLMGRVLKGEALPMLDILASTLVCVALTVAGILYVARTMRQAALK
jgi:sodium transport system permease protein